MLRRFERSFVTVLRTPDACFDDLPGYPFAPHYVEVPNLDGGPLRMHYVDAGPEDGPIVLLLHGEPTWSYLYRKVIPVLVAAGLRAIAPDHIGFGRSDKLSEPTDYSYARHISWMGSFISSLDLRGVTLFGQDWGGAIGLSAVAARPERFDRLILGNTMLHTLEAELAGKLGWAAHSDETTSTIAEGLLNWVTLSQRLPVLRPSLFVNGSTVLDLPPNVAAAYDAPFPEPQYLAGVRQFPILIPMTRSDPGAKINRETWRVLEGFERPVLTAFSDLDPTTAGWDRVFQQRIPGASGQPHVTLRGGGHFLQEDCGEELGGVIAEFVASTAS
jgi:haloalkane dehalogenase